MTTINDVARRAGVAPITVSRVINNASYVSAETRQRVQQAIAELNYIPNALGSSLRSKRTGTLALVFTDMTNPFWMTVARGVEDAANKQRYHLIIGNTDDSSAKQDEYLTFLLQKQVDGFLIVPVLNSSPALELFIKRRVPLVVLDRRITFAADSVRGDSEGGAYELTRHLLGLGHQHIAMISGPQEVSTACDRVLGYRRALKEAGLGNLQMVYWGDFTQKTGYKLAKQVLLATPRPTAIFGANNTIAIGVMQAVREAGLRVPDYISIVAFDDLPLTLTIDPFFTVMAQPAYEMGQKAAELLLSRLSGEVSDTYQEIILPTTLIARRSSARVAEP
jgi:LacI family transcriptional regulator